MFVQNTGYPQTFKLKRGYPGYLLSDSRETFASVAAPSFLKRSKLAELWARRMPRSLALEDALTSLPEAVLGSDARAWLKAMQDVISN